ncbi:MAG: glutamate-1-semialdehyde 2,1-aminomutase [Acidobacteria bacterium]|nr:glutamate-1-semialdehyde 2,1-aminomutase [Acidobacteriota bacterium]MBI3424895.1 glutamate-1-semialdehyde 2,1-aminomutase [Acidobacteriota bacterium]
MVDQTSAQYFARALQVAPGGVHSPVRAFKSVGGTPVFFQSAQGALLTSVEGREYIDFCQSFGPLLLGHRDPDVSAEVHAAIETAWSFGACEPYSLALAEWITARLPWVEKLRFVSSGTEAVMSALRVARAATGRQRVLKFEGCYHGHADALLVKAGSGLAGVAASTSAGVSEAVASETLVAPLDDDAALEEVFATYGHEIAVVVIEPLPANYGLLLQRPEFLSRLAQLARQHGALLLFDEVISGFRVARGGMVEMLGLTPDLVCYGKIIGGGFPVGCYGGRRALLDLVAPSGPVYQAGTLSANPVGMRAGLATLQKAEHLNVWAQLETKTAQFCAWLNGQFSERSLPYEMTYAASLFWLRGQTAAPIRSIAQIPAEHSAKFARIFHAALAHGVYLAPSGYEVGFVSLAHTDALLERAAQVLLEAVSAAQA